MYRKTISLQRKQENKILKNLSHMTNLPEKIRARPVPVVEVLRRNRVPGTICH